MSPLLWPSQNRRLMSVDIRSTALGAALLAGSALKLFGWSLDDPATLKDVNQAGVKIFKPSLAEDEREWKYKGWERAINRSRGWKSQSPFLSLLLR